MYGLRVLATLLVGCLGSTGLKSGMTHPVENHIPFTAVLKNAVIRDAMSEYFDDSISASEDSVEPTNINCGSADIPPALPEEIRLWPTTPFERRQCCLGVLIIILAIGIAVSESLSHTTR